MSSKQAGEVELPERISAGPCSKCGVMLVGMNACPHCGNDWIGTRVTYTRATPAPAGEVGDLNALQAAYNQGVEDCKTAIRDEGVTEDEDYFAARFINAIARKCSPHRYTAHSSPTTDARPRRVACMNPNCVDGKVSVGCSIDKPLLTVDCPDCSPHRRDWQSNKHHIPTTDAHERAFEKEK